MNISPTLFASLLVAVGGIIGLAVRSWVKGRIQHEFQVKIENVKAEHAKDMETLKAEIQREFELIKTEAAVVLQQHSAETEARKAALLQAVTIRAQKFPALIGCLRHMKSILDLLHGATCSDCPSDKCQPIDLSSVSDEATKVRNSFDELMTLTELFEETLSEVRLFVHQSQFLLPLQVKAFVAAWKDGSRGNEFSISKNEIHALIERYSTDIGQLTGEFYGSGPAASIKISATSLWADRMFGDDATEKKQD